MNVGARIKELRKAKGLSTRQLADLTNISQPVISRLETNNRAADIDSIQLICEALGMQLHEFFAPPLDKSLLRLLNAAEKLTPEELEKLTSLLMSILEKRDVDG